MANTLFQWMIASVFTFVHPYHVSMTEIQYNKSTKALEVSVRVDTDELEKAIKQTTKGKVDLLNEAQKETTNKLLAEYITKQVKIKVNGKDVEMNYFGFETQEGNIWSYFEVPNIAAVNTIDVTNTLLHESQDKQVNFIHVKAGKTDQTIKLDYPDKSKSFTIN